MRKPANGLAKTFDLIAVGGGAAGATCAGRLAAQNSKAVDAHIDAHLGTAYHPVGTCAIGAVVGHDLAVRGIHRLSVADASVMPRITSANTNAPSIMIGHRAARLITQQIKAK
ncbi:hypothetical protein PM03_02865 [Thalassobacter stenotrophicus]|nr:hypothetical protein PM03_02865 [Thalassobacter stenotrophicus]KGL02411.1 hypothetical protein PM04_06885 [Thalassobacter sp. 16PALIMAR09]